MLPPPPSPPDSATPPPALAGFEHLNRYWDHAHSCWLCKVLPGEIYVSRQQELITTVLGSCVSTCIYDLQHGVGGLNHFMLPKNGVVHEGQWGSDASSATTRFGTQAMEQLLQSILDHGGVHEDLEVKLFGGGKIMASLQDVGLQNIQFAEHYLQTQQLKLIGKDMGGPYPRRILFDPHSGRVWVKKLRSLHNNTIVKREEDYQQSIHTIITGRK